MSDQELGEYLDGISFTDNAEKDWKDKPELGLDPDDDEDADDVEGDEDDLIVDDEEDDEDPDEETPEP